MDLALNRTSRDHLNRLISSFKEDALENILDYVYKGLPNSTEDISEDDYIYDDDIIEDLEMVGRGAADAISKHGVAVGDDIEANCTNQIYVYLTVVLGSVLALVLLLVGLASFFLWRRFIKRDDVKKVSRAESWRYESSIYVNPGRQKPSVPVYVPTPTIPTVVSSSISREPTPTIPPALPSIQASQTSNFEDAGRNSRMLSSDVKPEECSNYTTLERQSTGGSTRECTPQITPVLASRKNSSLGGWSRTSTMNGHTRRTGTPGSSPLSTPHTSPLLARARGASAHQRSGSISTALRGVDIIRCTTPGYPPPSPPGQRRRQISLTERGSETVPLVNQ